MSPMDRYSPVLSRVPSWRDWSLGVLLWIGSSGLLVAILVGLLATAFAESIGSFGWFFAAGIPFASGVCFGAWNGTRSAVLFFGALAVLASVVTGLLMLDVGGMLCVLIVGVIFLVPTLLGAVLGAFLGRRWARARHPVTALLLVIGLAGGLVSERALVPPAGEEMVTTQRTLPLGGADAWERLMFYEEVPLRPPLLARIGLPIPLRTEGGKGGIGDVKRCVYTTGVLRKRITRLERGRLLEFEVIEQTGIEDHAVDLRRGSFRFEPDLAGGTRVTLTTTYRPLLSARPVWRPFEEALAHVLHGHVLDGMALQRAPDVAWRSVRSQ